MLVALLVLSACDSAGTCDEDGGDDAANYPGENSADDGAPNDENSPDDDAPVDDSEPDGRETLEDGEEYCAVLSIMDEACEPWRFFSSRSEELGDEDGFDDGYVGGCFDAARFIASERYTNTFEDAVWVDDGFQLVVPHHDDCE